MPCPGWGPSGPSPPIWSGEWEQQQLEARSQLWEFPGDRETEPGGLATPNLFSPRPALHTLLRDGPLEGRLRALVGGLQDRRSLPEKSVRALLWRHCCSGCSHWPWVTGDTGWRGAPCTCSWEGFLLLVGPREPPRAALTGSYQGQHSTPTV